MQISKLDAARRQIETAVVLYFHEGDPVSIHTLTGAAYEVLRDMSRAMGGPAMLKDWVLEYIRSEYAADFRARLNEAQNFFKHADRDPGASIQFETKQNQILLLDACWAYRRLTGERLPLLGVFEMWAALTWAKRFLIYEGMERIEAEFKDRVSRMSRQAFFDEMIPVAYHSTVSRPDA